VLSSVGSGLLGQGTDTGSLHGDYVFAIGGDKLHLRVVTVSQKGFSTFFFHPYTGDLMLQVLNPQPCCHDIPNPRMDKQLDSGNHLQNYPGHTFSIYVESM